MIDPATSELRTAGPGPTAPDDRELVAEARRGSTSAFSTLVERWQGPVFNFLLQQTRSTEDAADLTQESFFRAWRRLDQYDPQWSFSTWLFAIARRIRVDHGRRQLRRNRTTQLGVPPTRSPDPDPAATADEIETAGRVWSLASEVLSVEQRGALWLRYAFDATIDDLSKVFGKTRLATRVMLFRARQRLLVELQREERASTPERGQRPIAMTPMTEVA